MNPFRSAQEATRQQEMNMAAPNAQPSGKRPGPKAAHTHATYSAGKPGSQSQSPSPSSPGRTAPIKTTPTGPNKNRLH